MQQPMHTFEFIYFFSVPHIFFSSSFSSSSSFFFFFFFKVI